MIIIQTFKKENDVLSLPKTLEIHKPHFIIMYDADMTAIRQIEVSNSVFIYTLVHTVIHIIFINLKNYTHKLSGLPEL